MLGRMGPGTEIGFYGGTLEGRVERLVVPVLLALLVKAPSPY